MKTIPFKQKMLWATLIVTLAVTAWTAVQDDNTETAVIQTSKQHIQPARRSGIAAATTTAETLSISKEQLVRQYLESPKINLFDTEPATSIQVMEQAATPVRQEVPELPYTYAGKLEENGHTLIFLLKGGQQYVVKEGDRLGKWILQQIEPTMLVFTYRPMNTQVSIKIGDSN
jgi:hypothetical protein